MYLYCGEGNTALFEMNLVTYAITDRSSQITTSATGAKGAFSYKGYFVYALATSVRARQIPVTGGTDTEILTGLTSGEHPFAIGADLNLYFPNGNSIGKITNVTGTSGNSTNVFSLESGMNIRAVKSDGRYLVIIADDRQANSSGVGAANCVVAYWDYASGTLTQRFDFKDPGMLALEILEGNAYVWGWDALYVSNIATFPKPIIPFRNSMITARPVLQSQVTVKNNSVLWVNGTIPDISSVYGYGSWLPGQPKILYNPFAGFSGKGSAINWNGSRLFVCTDAPKVYTPHSNNKETSYINTPNIVLPAVYKPIMFKVTASDKLISGNSIYVAIFTSQINQNLVMDGTMSYTNDSAIQSKVFRPKIYIPQMRDIGIGIQTNTPVESIEVFGEELPQEYQW
jgi:hypothetical protein